MKVEEQGDWVRAKVSDAVEAAAEAAFKVDWPKDDWDRLGDGFHQARYRRIADAAINAYKEKTNV